MYSKIFVFFKELLTNLTTFRSVFCYKRACFLEFNSNLYVQNMDGDFFYMFPILYDFSVQDLSKKKQRFHVCVLRYRVVKETNLF
jgi:hypothetical protein